jgi:Arc/MetJ family transcription regulator
VVEGAQAATKLDWRRLRTKTKLVRNIFPEQTKNLTAFFLLQRQRVVTASAPSTTVRSLRELQWSPSPAIVFGPG